MDSFRAGSSGQQAQDMPGNLGTLPPMPWGQPSATLEDATSSLPHPQPTEPDVRREVMGGPSSSWDCLPPQPLQPWGNDPRPLMGSGMPHTLTSGKGIVRF